MDPYGNPHEEDLFKSGEDDQNFWKNSPSHRKLTTAQEKVTRVPAEFPKLAKDVFHHSSPDRFSLIYQALCRINAGERHLLEMITDDLVFRMLALRKQVTRDSHKMKAFVRFRKVERDGADWYVAWHPSDHPVLRNVAGFFRDRFSSMNWTILTPWESASWNGSELQYHAGVARDPIGGDHLEELWQTYYASTFNPARANPAMMKSEMPVRYWKSMPETKLIAGMLESSKDRTSAMLTTSGATALDYLPKELTIENLRKAAQACRGCPLYHNTHHAVCSEGPANARLALVGEQPGDREDMEGRPFVGPSGDILTKAIGLSVIRREEVYITESVKHFKHEIVGKRRIHRTPDASEIAACRPWLMAELQVLQPQVIVCLGVTAAQSILGKKVTLKEMRGQVVSTPHCPNVIVTIHPAAVLRQPDPKAAEESFQQLVTDLRRAADLCDEVAGP